MEACCKVLPIVLYSSFALKSIEINLYF